MDADRIPGRRLNVLLAPVAYRPLKSGVPIIVEHLAKGVRNLGHQVAIVAPQVDSADQSLELIDGIEVHRMRFVFPWTMLWEKPGTLRDFCGRGPADLTRLVRWIKLKRFDVINVHALTGPHLPYVCAAQRLTAIPLVATLHGSEFFRLDASKDRVRRWLLSYCLRRAKRVTAVSAQVARDAMTFCPGVGEKIIRIPNGVPIEEFDEPTKAPGTTPYVVSIGRLNRLKGHDVLLAAFRKIAGEEQGARLIIAGDGSERVRLRALTLALGLGDQVSFAGEADAGQVRRLLAHCQFLVMSSWNEGIPLVALEAMASGKAIVATRVGGLPEIIVDGETGFLVPPGDPNALADAMLRLLRDSARRESMGDRARALAREHYDVARGVEAYVGAYRAALEPAPGG